MDLDIVLADPAGNRTVFVLTPVQPQDYIPVARKIMAYPELAPEQVGYLVPPQMGGDARLEMMGGEFCGNAARSLGMLVAYRQDMRGRQTILVECSGAPAPLSVNVDLDAGEAETVMPLPLSLQEHAGTKAGRLAFISFTGILHIIAPDLDCNEVNFRLVRSLVPDNSDYDALGVMFYNVEHAFMRPAVYVKGTDSLVFESSCGSGTVAASVWRSLSCPDGKTAYEIRQPGGMLKASVIKTGGQVTEVHMGGPVTVYPKQAIHL